MAQPKVVYLIADTPQHERSIATGQPPTTLAAYRVEYDGKQDDAVASFIARGGFPPGSVFGRVAESAVHALHLRPTLEAGNRRPGEPADLHARGGADG